MESPGMTDGIGVRSTNRLLYITLALALGFGAQNVAAEELSLLLNGHAWHVNPPSGTDYNERNWGAGMQYDFDATENNWVPFLMASGFIDSMDNPSYYAGGGIQKRFDLVPEWDNFHVALGGVAFLMTREDFRGGKPFFGALPAFTVGTDTVALNITYVPRVDPKMVELWFFQLKIPVVTF